MIDVATPQRKVIVGLGGVFLVLLLLVAVRDWWGVRRESLHDIRWHTTTVTRLLRQHLEQAGPLAELLRRLDDPAAYRELDERVRQRIGAAGLRKVHIYDRRGEIVYASDGRLVGNWHQGEAALAEAFTGVLITKFIDPEQYHKEYGEVVPTDLAEVYLPVEGGPGQGVSHVFETYYDFSPFLARHRRLWLANAAVLGAVVLGGVGVLLLALRRNRVLAGRVRALESFLPICCYCKKIRVEDAAEGRPGRWKAVESYFGERDEVRFSHGICEDCLAEHHPTVGRPR